MNVGTVPEGEQRHERQIDIEAGRNARRVALRSPALACKRARPEGGRAGHTLRILPESTAGRRRPGCRIAAQAVDRPRQEPLGRLQRTTTTGAPQLTRL